MSNQPRDEQTQNTIKAFGLLCFLLSLIFIPAIILSISSNNVDYEVVKKGRFTRIDYTPKFMLNQRWTLEIWTVKKTEGSGEYRETFYPYLVRWWMWVQGYNDNIPIGEQDYNTTDEHLKHPEEKVELIFTFESPEFTKDTYLLKLRSIVLIGNDTYRDSIDFQITLEGYVTWQEIAWVSAFPGFFIAVVVYLKIRSALNKRYLEEVTIFNTPIYLFRYLVLAEFTKRRKYRPLDENR